MDPGFPLSSSSSAAPRVQRRRKKKNNERAPQFGVVRSSRLRGTEYQFTFNTNRKPRFQGEAAVALANLNDAIAQVINTRKKLLRFVMFRNDDGGGPDYDNSRWHHLIDSFQVSWGVEIAPTTGFVHAHATVTIYHHVGEDGVRLWTEKLRETLDAEMRKHGSQLPYMFYRVGTPGVIWDDYIHKAANQKAPASSFQREEETDSESD